MVVYEREGRFQRGIAEEMVDGLKKAFGAVGTWLALSICAAYSYIDEQRV